MRVHRKKGATLIEAIVATVLLVVIIGILMATLLGTLQTYSRVQSGTQTEQEGQFIISRLGYSMGQGDQKAVAYHSTLADFSVTPTTQFVSTTATSTYGGEVGLSGSALTGTFESNPITLAGAQTIRYMKSTSTKPAGTTIQYQVGLITNTTGTCPNTEASYNYVLDTTGNPPVAWFKMDDSTWTGTSADVTDSVAGAYTGTAQGGAQLTTNGKYLKGGSFGGTTDYVSLGGSTGLGNSSVAMTMEAWVKFNAIPTGSTVMTAISKNETAAGWGLIANAATSGKIETYFYIGGAYRLAGEALSNLTAGTWYHIAATFDGSNVRFYRDGTLKQTVAASGSILTSAEPVFIGADPSAGGTDASNFFNGFIDDVKIYDYVRTQGQIITDMNGYSTDSNIDYFEMPIGSYTNYDNPVSSQGGCIKYKLTYTRPSTSYASPITKDITFTQ